MNTDRNVVIVLKRMRCPCMYETRVVDLDENVSNKGEDFVRILDGMCL